MATTARFTTGVGEDNTARVNTQSFSSPAYAASLAIKSSGRNTYVQVGALTGNLSLTINTGSATTSPYVLDEITFLFLASGAPRTVTFSTGFAPSATLVIADAKRASATFIFDGAKWVEKSRGLEA